jgi:putative SOS response-associated peptidase YedK
MCGRFTNSVRREQLAERFEITVPDTCRERFNVAPAQAVLGIRQREESTEALMMRWGLIPHWAKDMKIAFKMINARAETLPEKPAYRSLLSSKRCLIPADGFYEWRVGADGKKEPIHFTLLDEPLFAFAGLWSSWTDRETGEVIDSCTIITTGPNELVAPVHNRMPVILTRDAEQAWLSPEVEKEEALSLLLPYPAAAMRAVAVSREVGSVRNDYAALLDPLELAA